MAVGISLVFYAGSACNAEQKSAVSAGKYSISSEKNPREQSLAQLSNIERYTVLKGRVVG